MLRGYQWAELLGILFLLASTATQIFYVEPLKREIEWRLAAFSVQQVGHIQADATLTNRVELLTAMNADSAAIGEAKAARAKLKDRFETADANVANYVIGKEWIENALQVTVMGCSRWVRFWRGSAARWRWSRRSGSEGAPPGSRAGAREPGHA